jgi:hypothetical protein
LFGSFDPANLVSLLVGRFQESTVCKKTAILVLSKALGLEAERLKELQRKSSDFAQVLVRRHDFVDGTGYRLPIELNDFYRNTIQLPPLSRLITGPRPPLPRGPYLAPYLRIPDVSEIIYEIRRLEDDLLEKVEDHEAVEWDVLSTALSALHKAFRIPPLPDLSICDPKLPWDFIMLEAVQLLRRERRSWNAQGTIFSTGDDSWIRLCRTLQKIWKSTISQTKVTPIECTLLNLEVEAGSSTR